VLCMKQSSDAMKRWFAWLRTECVENNGNVRVLLIMFVLSEGKACVIWWEMFFCP